MRFLTWLATYAVALAAAAWLLDGIHFTGATSGSAEVSDKLGPLLVVAAILGVITSVVKPVLKVLSLPFILLTLGLFLLVINAVLLLLTGWVAGGLGVGFHVDGFWTAVGGSIVITVVTWAVDSLLGERDRR
jgi:putative membrane protein